MFEWVKEEIKNTSSGHYKYSLVLNIIGFVFILVVTVPLSIYIFCLKDYWLYGFMPFSIAVLSILIESIAIKFMLKHYKIALEREKKEQENKIKEDNYETKNSL